MERSGDYLGRPDFRHDRVAPVGILLANLGTPDAPTVKALRPYLRQFLSDPRVIELPRWKWLPILYLFVLTFRPRRSARLYANIWGEHGSPLLHFSERIRDGLGERLAARFGTPVEVELGMSYGSPSISSALRQLADAGCDKLLVLPLFPQYFAGTTGTIFDAVSRELTQWRWVPELRMVGSYHDDPAYIEAVAASVRDGWGGEGPADKVIFSFHGIPKRYFVNGDPYFCHCQKSGRLLAERLGLEEDRYMVTFQSLFGREEWLKPYTDLSLAALAQKGTKSVDILCPGFATDCLETVDEVGREARESFLEAGGERFRFIPCLNDRSDHIDALTALAARNMTGWLEEKGAYDAQAAARAKRESAARADALKANPLPQDGLGSA